MLPLRVVLAGSLLFVTTAGAQVSPRSTVTRSDTTGFELKSPITARLIGIIPGAGHMYAGEVGRGFLYLGGTLVLFSAGAVAGLRDCMDEAISSIFLNERADCGSSAVVTVSFIAAGGLWVWSVFDAGRAARRTNAKRAANVSLILEPTRIPVELGEDRTAVRLGLQITNW